MCTLLRLSLMAVWLLASSNQALASASILIWPIDPVIEDQQPGTELWLENRDKVPVYMQIRVLGWQQMADKDDYSTQSAVIASPPVASIAPGKRQLIRLIKRYVLPSSQMRFALPSAGNFSHGKLLATVNDNEQPVVIPSY
ncbi:fimbrial biogenesis chaperone [Serratia symbiotica]|uniref:fimbrial biogenesis chaperone n=1 Tax=Serratia symbiotica TaxID=138074 RepID=UPI00077B8E2E|nr:fimbria/pilus periplasmic chaperone [Serratia symbiotica]